VADAVLHGQTGLLSQPEDSSALARNIMRLLEDGGLAQRLGAAGRSHVLARATWDSVAERLLQAMSGLPGASARPRREHEPLN
jgi:glycosyltransferase involved in cell wall biosynthesis